MNGAGFIAGEILAKDATSITIKGRDGSSKIVLYSGSTEVSKFAAGSIDDIAVGKFVSVNGKTNSDGSITAQLIQVRSDMPTPGSGGQGGTGQGQGTPPPAQQ